MGQWGLAETHLFPWGFLEGHGGGVKDSNLSRLLEMNALAWPSITFLSGSDIEMLESGALELGVFIPTSTRWVGIFVTVFLEWGAGASKVRDFVLTFRT